MGRQVSALLSDQQELDMLAFLRRSADVLLLHAFPETRSNLQVDAFAPRGDWNWHYYLWNREFSWSPKLQVDAKLGRFRITNSADAPVVEYTRQSFIAPEPVGRLYWSKGFSSLAPPFYNTVAFDKWFSSLARWVRRRNAT